MKLLFAIFRALLSVAVVGALVYWNWQWARPAEGERLRWVVMARTDIEHGHVITANDIRMTLRRWPINGERYVPTTALASGRFATRAIKAGATFTEQLISDGVGVAVNAGNAIVPVEVATNHTTTLVAGMMLAFANGTEMIPTAKELAKPNPEPAFTLLAIAPSPRDPGTTSLVMMVPACRLSLVSKLGSTTWRPVILGPVPSLPRTPHVESKH